MKHGIAVTETMFRLQMHDNFSVCVQIYNCFFPIHFSRNPLYIYIYFVFCVFFSVNI